jgi:hypothetical protein
MDTTTLITVLLTSTVISTLVSFLLKILFESRLEHKLELELEQLRHTYEVEIERLKTELTIKAETAHELTERRLSAYPGIVELVYRVRNMAREISNSPDISNVLFDELRARAQELENALYEFRMDLERDELFITIHTYKNAIKTFSRLLEDREHYRKNEDITGVDRVTGELRDLYNQIETLHAPIIKSLSGITPSEKRTDANYTVA